MRKNLIEEKLKFKIEKKFVNHKFNRTKNQGEIEWNSEN
jgi:hypothetical protein